MIILFKVWYDHENRFLETKRANMTLYLKRQLMRVRVESDLSSAEIYYLFSDHFRSLFEQRKYFLVFFFRRFFTEITVTAGILVLTLTIAFFGCIRELGKGFCPLAI